MNIDNKSSWTQIRFWDIFLSEVQVNCFCFVCKSKLKKDNEIIGELRGRARSERKMTGEISICSMQKDDDAALE